MGNLIVGIERGEEGKKLFEKTLRLYNREYFLSVFLMFNGNKCNYYRCVLDGLKNYDLRLNHNSVWIDMQNGSTELCDKLGQMIEEVCHPSYITR